MIVLVYLVTFQQRPGAPSMMSMLVRCAISRLFSGSFSNRKIPMNLVFVITDAVKTIDSDLKYFFAKLKEYKINFKKETDMDKEIVLMLNKCDLLQEMSEEDRPPFPAPDRFRHHFQDLDEIFSKVIPISALTGDNVPKVLAYAKSKAVDRPWLFPASVVRSSSLTEDRLCSKFLVFCAEN
jgi:GTPase Era involved in 16S rRNA processing